MKQNNKGMSLVELIVVMAIMAVLASAVGIGIGMISTKQVDQCATQLKSSVQGIRITTMGKYQTYLKVYNTANGVCIEEFTQDADGTVTSSSKIVGDSTVTVIYKLSDGTVFNLGDSSNPLYIEFDRSSGALKKLPASMGSAQEGKYCVEIEVSKGSKVRTLKIAYLTGKVTME
jgi:prepilin-type N-terminal cleavage/methylation domain-containing protein